MKKLALLTLLIVLSAAQTKWNFRMLKSILHVFYRFLIVLYHFELGFAHFWCNFLFHDLVPRFVGCGGTPKAHHEVKVYLYIREEMKERNRKPHRFCRCVRPHARPYA